MGGLGSVRVAQMVFGGVKGCIYRCFDSCTSDQASRESVQASRASNRLYTGD